MNIIITVLIIIVILVFIYILSIWIHPIEGFLSCFLKRDKSVNNLERLDNLYNMFGTILEYTKDTSVDIWPTYGTLLGIVREKGLICYDEDIDVGIDLRDFNQMVEIVKKIAKENNEFKYVVLNVPFLITYIRLYNKKTGIHCDISIYKKNKSKYERVYFNSDDKLGTDIGINLKPVIIEHKGKTYRVTIPNNSKELLKHWYGEDYMKPEFECDKNCENCIKR